MPSIIGSVNTFLVRSPERNLLIDCGGSDPKSFQVLFDALETIGVRWDRLDVFITHFHVDHFGGLDLLWRPGMRIYAGFDSALEQHTDIDERIALLRPMWEAFDKRIGTPAEKQVRLSSLRTKCRRIHPLSAFMKVIR